MPVNERSGDAVGAVEMTACTWCGSDASLCGPCSSCGLYPVVGSDSSSRPRPAGMKSRRDRVKSPAPGPLDLTPVGRPVLGVDPGARYVGLVLRDGDAVLWAETITADEPDTAVWCRLVVDRVGEVASIIGPTAMAVESITAPTGFKDGKVSSINPGFVARAAAVFGAVVGAFPGVVSIRPGGNGSRHSSFYPPALVGRRPEGLPGRQWAAGTRAHEQSAYDVAGKAALQVFGAQEFPVSALMAALASGTPDVALDVGKQF